MEHPSLTPYEAEQVAVIAAWKARKPGFLRRTIESLKWPLTRLFEKLVPADKARAMLARVHQAADWEQGRDKIQRHSASITSRNCTTARSNGVTSWSRRWPILADRSSRRKACSPMWAES